MKNKTKTGKQILQFFYLMQASIQRVQGTLNSRISKQAVQFENVEEAEACTLLVGVGNGSTSLEHRLTVP